MDSGGVFMSGSVGGTVAKLHPLVVFNMADSFVRRIEGHDRVIGTLLGSVDKDGAIEVKNSFAVPHNEANGQVMLDVEFERGMTELHQRVASKEQIVGWYTTGSSPKETDALIHDFYAREMATSLPGTTEEDSDRDLKERPQASGSPLMLTLDVAFENPAKSVRAWAGQALSLSSASSGSNLGTCFTPVAMELKFTDSERAGTELLTRQQSALTDGSEPAMGGIFEGGANADLSATAAHLRQLLAEASSWVSSNAKGGNETVGRAMADALAAVPKMDAASFGKLAADSAQDVLLVLYLATITKTQLALADRLNSSALPAPSKLN